MRKEHQLLAFALLAILGSLAAHQAEAAGCPFDDASCQEYCNTQGCNLGYCGHFAWIQCICRKCGDEWSWYDKVRYNPDKQVNQTELDSLKLNATAPLILTNSANGAPTTAGSSQARGAPKPSEKPASKATLTTLLIPDLSDSGRLADLNDVPDENSDKFLDYLAKNHERLAQATSGGLQMDSAGSNSAESQDDDHEDATTSQPANNNDDETIELQISTSNNGNSSQQSNNTADATKPAPSSRPQAQSQSAVTRLLKLVPASDDSLLASQEQSIRTRL